MNHPLVDEQTIRDAFLLALSGGKKIYRKTLVKLVADAGAIGRAAPSGRNPQDYTQLDLILGNMMVEGLVRQNRIRIVYLPNKSS